MRGFRCSICEDTLEISDVFAFCGIQRCFEFQSSFSFFRIVEKLGFESFCIFLFLGILCVSCILSVATCFECWNSNAIAYFRILHFKGFCDLRFFDTPFFASCTFAKCSVEFSKFRCISRIFEKFRKFFQFPNFSKSAILFAFVILQNVSNFRIPLRFSY